MTRLLLVRHGESTWNAHRQLQGQADAPLSDRGRRQAARLAALIRDLAPTRIVCSDLSRTRETAEILGHASAIRDRRWREIDVGEWTAASLDDLRRDQPDAFSGWRAGTYTPPGGENWQSFCARIRGALEELADPPGATALVVTHGGVIRAACALLVGLQPSHIIPVGPASLTVIDLSPTPKLRAFNVSANGLELDAPD